MRFKKVNESLDEIKENIKNPHYIIIYRFLTSPEDYDAIQDLPTPKPHLANPPKDA